VYNPQDAGNPPPAPSPSAAPAPTNAEDLTGGQRYQYLVFRLRNRQITMEEATELFAIQRQQVAVMLARTNALAAAAAVPQPTPRLPRPMAPPVTPTAKAAAAAAIEGLDLWGEGLLFLALGAGLFAALAKRAQGPAPAPAARPKSPASGTPRS
jgi:hypothetical protein